MHKYSEKGSILGIIFKIVVIRYILEFLLVFQ